ncbi:MAG: hypothetical protein ABI878_06005 [Acidobacteriota bacterium]
MERFNELGRGIEDLWRDLDYNEEVFPAIAAEALKKAELPSKISAWEIVEWTLGQSELPKQKDPRANFAEPPITLFNGPRFYIDAYFWLEGTTAIHQHGFCGAFQVLLGSSIHSWYEFEKREAINSFVEIGDMSLKVCQLLSVGDVQEIFPGRQYIHSLFHLDQPSVTIVIRTDKSALFLPQFSYHKPSLAVDPFYEHETTTRKLQVIAALFRSEHPETDRMIADVLKRSDLHTSYLILNAARDWLKGSQIDQLFGVSGQTDRFAALVAVTRERHGEKGKVLADVFERQKILDEILKLRHVVTDPEHRFFLALLLNVDGVENISRLIAQRFPDTDPIEKMLDWTFDLSNTRVVGLNIPNALGIPDFDSVDLQILEYMLRDVADADVTARLRADHGDDTAANLAGKLDEKIDRIRTAPIFKPLFATETDII